MEAVPNYIEGLIVDLWAAKLPYVGLIADHHWLVVTRDGVSNRWEIWNRRDAGGQSWAYLHKDMLAINRGIGNGGAYLLKQWHDEEAEALAVRIESAPTAYPWTAKYGWWPGPNSNTFVQWALQGEYDLGWRGWGGRYSARARA